MWLAPPPLFGVGVLGHFKGIVIREFLSGGGRDLCWRGVSRWEK